MIGDASRDIEGLRAVAEDLTRYAQEILDYSRQIERDIERVSDRYLHGSGQRDDPIAWLVNKMESRAEKLYDVRGDLEIYTRDVRNLI